MNEQRDEWNTARDDKRRAFAELKRTTPASHSLTLSSQQERNLKKNNDMSHNQNIIRDGGKKKKKRERKKNSNTEKREKMMSGLKQMALELQNIIGNNSQLFSTSSPLLSQSFQMQVEFYFLFLFAFDI